MVMATTCLRCGQSQGCVREPALPGTNSCPSCGQKLPEGVTLDDAPLPRPVLDGVLLDSCYGCAGTGKGPEGDCTSCGGSGRASDVSLLA